MTTLSVPDMSCDHCKASVTKALAAIPGTAAIEVDLTTKQIHLTSPAAPETLLAALDQIGFPATVLSAK